MQNILKIGELAAHTGITPKTIRYYELVGLLPQAERTETGYRVYNQQDLQRLDFVKKAKRLGFSLKEIKDLVSIYNGPESICQHVMALLDQKIACLDTLLESLSGFRRELAELRSEKAERLSRLPHGELVCHIVEHGIHVRTEEALTWLESMEKSHKSSQESPASS